MIVVDVSRQQPLHEAAEVSVTPQPERQMEVSGHQAVGHHPHPQPVRRHAEQLQKSRIVLGLPKDLRTRVPPVDHVVADTANRGPSCARHAGRLSDPLSQANRKVEYPLFFPSRILS